MSSNGVSSLKFSIRKGLLTCHYCNQRTADTVDHIVPDSLSGPDSIWNLQPSCGKCNRDKSSGWPTCGCKKCVAAVVRFLQNPNWTDAALDVLSRRVERMDEQLAEIEAARVRVQTNRDSSQQTFEELQRLILTSRYPFDTVDL